MNIEKVKNQLAIFGSLQNSLEKLHTQGFYSLFYTSFQSLHSQDQFFRSKDFKECLKLILSEMIDTVWSLSPMPNINYEPVNASPPPSQRTSSITPTRLLQKSVSSCANLRGLVPHNSGPSFTREKRNIQKEIPVTPGPGDYSIENVPVRSKSPSIIFTKEKRNLEIAHKDSPGPSAYSPNTHFQSKF